MVKILKKTTKFVGLLLLIGINSVILVEAQYNPHPDTIDYNEEYRGQYHFSPKTGWMNDINGLVYQNGEYHMIFQWGKSIRHGGYATSPDLLHWTDKGIALIPQDTDLPDDATPNVSGLQVFSGSAVVVSGETANAITGSTDEAITIIYTGVGAGTCLAWSNDGGLTWNNYDNNPVANPTNGADPRDPAVFWHEPSGKWIMAIYENGTTFYGSTDLINWNQLSNINFGFECPDIFQLPIDGDYSNMKWVLMDANGTYLIGQFDGSEFTSEEGPYLMDVGPDFYAAQTFFQPNLPSGKIIQIAWMDKWNGGIGEKVWERNATFPVEIGLVSYNDQIRVTRNPIPAITSLYEDTLIWEDMTISEGLNILSGVKSKTFDITAVFDISETSAESLGFRVANRTITYNTSFHKLEGSSLAPTTDNLIKIRMLVDWSMLEIFGNDGLFSYSQQYAFIPRNDNLELFTKGGDVKLVSLEFHNVARTWPGKDINWVTRGDDLDTDLIYSNNWTTDTNQIYYNNTCHYTYDKNASVEYNFYGNEISWYGLKGSNLGMADVYIDNVWVAHNIDCYSSSESISIDLLYKRDSLELDNHTIKIIVAGEKNPLSSDSLIYIDYFLFTENNTMKVDDQDEGVYVSSTYWTVNNDDTYYKNTCSYTNITNAYFEYQFTGTFVEWYGLKNTDLGIADVYIDDQLLGDNIDTYGTTRAVYKLFSKYNLEQGEHTIKVVVTGEKNTASTGTFLVHDYFVVERPSVLLVPFWENDDTVTSNLNQWEEDKFSVTLYPNPFSESATIAYRLQKNENVLIKIFNSQGQLIYTQTEGYRNAGNQEAVIQRKSLQNGLYFFRIETSSMKFDYGRFIIKKGL